MSMTFEKSDSRSRKVMYIRGVPFVCPDSGKSRTETPPEAVAQMARRLDFCANRLLARRLLSAESAAVPLRSEARVHAGLMERRRAVRVFADQAVPMRQLRALVLSACDQGDVPSARRASFVVVESRKVMIEIADILAAWLRREGLGLDSPDPQVDARRLLFGGAPHLAVVHGRLGVPGAAEACALAVARLEWAAAAAGLGSCFAGELVQAALADSAVAAALTVPYGHTVYGAVLLGVPAVTRPASETPPDTTILWL